MYEPLLEAASGQLSKRTGVSANQLKALTASANDAGVSGTEARHAIPQSQPYKRAMTLPEGRDFVAGMLRDWT